MISSLLFKGLICLYFRAAQGFTISPALPGSAPLQRPPRVLRGRGPSRLTPIAAGGTGHDSVCKEVDTLLASSVKELGWDDRTQTLLHDALDRAGVSFQDLLAISVGCDADQIVRMLRNDFQIDPPLLAHQLRAVLVHAMGTSASRPAQASERQRTTPDGQRTSDVAQNQRNATEDSPSVIGAANETSSRRPTMKSVYVNSVAARRKQTQQREYEYGLNNSFAGLTSDLDRFYAFMTRPSPYSQEDPIRPATATVYLRHAKLFLGWYMRHYRSMSASSMLTVALDSILPSSDKAAAAPFIEYVLWLRNERQISASYEANVLRGLTKMVKFRFAEESESTSASPGIQSYQDIPLVSELRKLHRVANRQQKLSPRSSNEQLKWISWPEYLKVVEACRQRAHDSLTVTAKHSSSRVTARGRNETDTASYSPQQREIAIAWQRYLVLAIFASVPDRQRTIRELQVGKTLILDEATGCYCIRHAPHEYKTGKTYGERPLLRLPIELTASIDTFLTEWRQCLRPNTDALFVQPRTGNPLTRDSVYQLVSRACFEHTGKRTNPHLLRDMIVTHVRESSNASEKELEALALFMGHSLQMQRTSYDRRTLTSKVAPAVQLLNQVNSGVLSSES